MNIVLKILLYLISSLFLVIMVLFDILKLPIVIFVSVPIYLFLTLLDRIKGEKTFFWKIVSETLILGILTWKLMIKD